MMIRSLFTTALLMSPASIFAVVTTFPSLGEQATVVPFELTLLEGASSTRIWYETPEGDGWQKRASILLAPDKTGGEIFVVTQEWSAAEGKWERRSGEPLLFWPKEKTPAELSVKSETPKRWSGQPLHGTLRMADGKLGLWLEGRLLFTASLPDGGGKVFAEVGHGGVLKPGTALPLTESERWVTVDLGGLAPARLDEREWKQVGEVPFELRKGGAAGLSLREAGWRDWRTEPGNFYEVYDAGAAYVNDPSLPLVQIPKGDYIAAYLLAEADADPKTSNHLTLRIGRRKGGSGPTSQVVMRDYSAIVPRTSEAQPEPQLIRIPLDGAFSQRVEDELLDVELTKEIRLARRHPDPNRFRWRPLGLPSGVRIVALTFERSPIVMEVLPQATGSLFAEKEAIHFEVRLTNTTEAPQPYELTLSLSGKAVTRHGELPARESTIEAVELPSHPPGHYTLDLHLAGERGALATRDWPLGVLPAGERKWRAEAPWGTWDNCGAALNHFAPNDPEVNASVTEKLGFRYGLFFVGEALRQKVGVLKGNTIAVRMRTPEPEKIAERFRALLAEDPDQPHDLLLFHEDSISGEHATRIPDLFVDRPPYSLNDEEEQEFQKMWKMAETVAKAMRAALPEARLHLGNGGLTLREEFYRRGFPAEWFDTGGNENGSFSRIPESQPPDPIANNASLWMDRQLLDAYGYHDKPVSQCYETIYPSTNPGNLSYQTQADYLMRHLLHSLAWGVPRISPGGIADAGNSYYHGNWGACGFMMRRPEFTPKPAAVRMAALTLTLDGCTYDGFHDTGSESVYLMRFRRKEGGLVLPYWVVRGERELRLTLSGAGQFTLISPDGAREEVPVKEGAVTLTATASPAWLILPEGAKVSTVTLGEPRHLGAEPMGKVTALAPLASLDGWKILPGRNALLEQYNPMAPRRKGDFEWLSDQGIRVRALALHSGKPTMPMYGELEHSEGIALPGEPAEIGLYVEGNSAWGRIIFELEDAKGQRWISIGAQEGGAPSDWMADWVGADRAAAYRPGDRADWNTDDAWGLSRINFDGWRYVGIPLPGQYPGEGYPWPANSQWRWDGDGVVHYPLTLRKIVVELPEKTLYLTRYAPARNPWVRLKQLVAVDRDISAPKEIPGDYLEAVQTTIR